MSSKAIALKILIDYYSYHLDGLEDQSDVLKEFS
jgi:hypothetical protein